jgi:pre-mRNA-splicing factor SPF27
MPGLRAQLESLVEAELQSAQEGSSSSDLSDRLPPEIPELFSGSTLLQSEVARVSSSAAKPKTGPGAGLDSIRYTLPAPPLSAPLTAWNKALDNASSQLEHQGIRLSNLEMLSKYGANAWRVSNYLVEQEIARLQASTESIRTSTDEVNRERKAKQVSRAPNHADLRRC